MDISDILVRPTSPATLSYTSIQAPADIVIENWPRDRIGRLDMLALTKN